MACSLTRIKIQDHWNRSVNHDNLLKLNGAVYKHIQFIKDCSRDFIRVQKFVITPVTNVLQDPSGGQVYDVFIYINKPVKHFSDMNQPSLSSALINLAVRSPSNHYSSRNKHFQNEPINKKST